MKNKNHNTDIVIFLICQLEFVVELTSCFSGIPAFLLGILVKHKILFCVDKVLCFHCSFFCCRKFGQKA